MSELLSVRMSEENQRNREVSLLKTGKDKQIVFGSGWASTAYLLGEPNITANLLSQHETCAYDADTVQICGNI